jgi:hypothetical protein
MSEIGVIKGSGDSKSLKKGHSSAIAEYNSFVFYYVKFTYTYAYITLIFTCLDLSYSL